MASTLQEIQQKAAVDGTFRAALKADPKAALAGAGIDVPAGITVEIIEAGFNRLPIVIPPAQSGRLSDEALDGVVGGSAQATDFVGDFIGH